MKLGLLWMGQNKCIEKRTEMKGPSTAFEKCAQFLYPDELFAVLSVRSPDIELCNECDAVIFLCNSGESYHFLQYSHRIRAIKIFLNHGGYNNMITGPTSSITSDHLGMNDCDLVLVNDYDKIPIYKAWTRKPLFVYPLPYPVKVVEKLLLQCDDSLPRYDVLVSHGISVSNGSGRNGGVACKIAQDIVSNSDAREFGVFVYMGDSDPALAAERNTLAGLGCFDYNLIPRCSLRAFMTYIKHSKVVVDMDTWEAAGRIAMDTAIARKPGVFSNRIPLAKLLYNNMPLHNPFDITSASATGISVIQGMWHDEWLDIAYERACQYDLPIYAEKLEHAVLQVKKWKDNG